MQKWNSVRESVYDLIRVKNVHKGTLLTVGNSVNSSITYKSHEIVSIQLVNKYRYHRIPLVRKTMIQCGLALSTNEFRRLHNCFKIYRIQYSVIRWNLKEAKFSKQNFKISRPQLVVSIMTLIHGLCIPNSRFFSLRWGLLSINLPCYVRAPRKLLRRISVSKTLLHESTAWRFSRG